jgi:hypothetical protein
MSNLGTMAKPHHSGSYSRRAAAVRAYANANPDTRCWRCGRTLQQHPPHRNGRPPTWHAGHVIDGQIGGLLKPEASTCNKSAGASYGNRTRRRPYYRRVRTYW